MSRPTLLTAELKEKAKEYLLSCEDEEIERGSEERPVYHIKVKLPSVEGLSRYLGVARSSLYKWAKEDSEFSDILENLLAEQADKLISNGLSGDYNPTITKLILTKHGYSDKQETDLTSKGNAIVFMPPEIAEKNNIPMNDTDTSASDHSE